MLLTQELEQISIEKEEDRYCFLHSGDMFSLTSKGYLLNSFRGLPWEGGAGNIWIRVFSGADCTAYPLLGRRSGASLEQGKESLRFRGRAGEITYTVTFFAAGQGVWLWDVALEGDEACVDLIYGQDTGVGREGAVLTNELYLAQYLGHSVFQTTTGYHVCSRQNQEQGGRNPYLQQGMLRGQAVSYSTDAMQFFGLEYKKTGVPQALRQGLEGKNRQLESSYIALQSHKFALKGREAVTFYGLFRPDCPQAVSAPAGSGELCRAFEAFEQLDDDYTPVNSSRRKACFGEPYCSTPWERQRLEEQYPSRCLVEEREGQLHAFFTPGHSHVVTQAKELQMERPHGTIVQTGIDMSRVSSRVLCATQYINGIFASHVSIGNTDFHKLFSTPRGLLDLVPGSGLRLWVELDGVYRRLALPAVYEMGMNYSRWYYDIKGDTLCVTSFTAMDETDLTVQVESLGGREYRFMATGLLVLGTHEFAQPVEVEEPLKGLLRLSMAGRGKTPYPGLHFDLQVVGAECTPGDDRVFYEDERPRTPTLLTLGIGPAKEFRIIVRGSLEQREPVALPAYCFKEEAGKALKRYEELCGGFRLEGGAGADQLEKLNQMAWWYTHNAMVHFASPHGLEQPGGAAWGSRDVCQGPFEFFMATGNFGMVRSILCRIFSRQILETGEWAQWFMYDRYTLNPGECHGDVVFWPLKCIGDYLEATGDYGILAEPLPYLRQDGRQTEDSWTLLAHVEEALRTIESRFVGEGDLISYAGGDWDDTLQPADPALKERLVSAWTQALAYQVTAKLGKVLEPAHKELAGKAAHMAELAAQGFREKLVADGVIAGFAHLEQDGSLRYMLHPRDRQTGIKYRLLPMTRSIIGELAGPEQAEANLELIDRYFYCPDGVRLMDRPTAYSGGVSTLFRRAEQAANVGREISLMYTHAHIRYIEALAKMGRGGAAWKALFPILAPLIENEAPNALPRQSNLYFSSSDGDFSDRYAYSEGYHRLRTGEVAVKGGWRLYSSGPGIYFNQMVAQVLGIRLRGDGVEIDPVLPKELDGLLFTFRCFGRPVTFAYRITREGGVTAVLREGRQLKGTRMPNLYRAGSLFIAKDELLGGEGPVDITIGG